MIFGEGVFVHIIEDFKIRPSWLRVGTKSNDKWFYRRHREAGHVMTIDMGEGDVKMKAEIEIKQATSQGTLGANRNWKRQGRTFL